MIRVYGRVCVGEMQILYAILYKELECLKILVPSGVLHETEGPLHCFLGQGLQHLNLEGKSSADNSV